MGRELHRVPLDFNWPLNKVWQGFINSHFRPCPEAAKNNCHGGNTSAGRWLDAIVHLISLVGQEGYQNTPEMHAHWAKHPWLQEWGMAPRTKIPHDVDEKLCAIEDQHERFAALDQYRRQHPAQLLTLDSEIAALVSGLAKGRNLGPLAGGETSYAIYRTLIDAAGITDERWGVCKVCDGHGIDPDAREVYENWEREPPPTGEGWQLWETVSEGSPISPVFATEAAFVDYLTTQGYSTSAAKAFAQSGWAPSGVGMRNAGGEMTMVNGIEALGIGEGDVMSDGAAKVAAALRGAILAVTGVTKVDVEPDVGGGDWLVRVVVTGGGDLEIAKAIALALPVWFNTLGQVRIQVPIVDQSSAFTNIAFDRH